MTPLGGLGHSIGLEGKSSIKKVVTLGCKSSRDSGIPCLQILNSLDLFSKSSKWVTLNL